MNWQEGAAIGQYAKGSWYAEMAATNAAINEMAALIAKQDAALRLAREVLGLYWFTSGDGEDYNNDDVIAACATIDAVLKP